MPIPTDRYVCEMTFYVRYAETDAMGIVHHSNYLVYCEELRSQYSRETGYSYADFERDGLGLVVSEANLRFAAPAVYGQKITIRGWVEDIKSRRVTFAYEVCSTEDGTIHMTGITNHICVTRDGKVTRFPEESLKRWGVQKSNE